jgi:hypothetical protein
MLLLCQCYADVMPMLYGCYGLLIEIACQENTACKEMHVQPYFPQNRADPPNRRGEPSIVRFPSTTTVRNPCKVA